MPTNASGRPAPRTLADELRLRDDADLAALLRARPDVAVPAPTDLTQVASRAVTRVSVARAVDALDQGGVRVLEALAVLPDPTTAEALRAVVHAPAAWVDDVLRHLRRLALVWGDDRTLHLVRTVHEVVGPEPTGLGPPHPRLGRDDLAERLERVRRDEPRVDDLLARLAWGPPTGRLGRSNPVVDALVDAELLLRPDDASVVLPREVGLLLRGGRTTAERVDVPPPVATSEVAVERAARVAAGAVHELVQRVELLVESWGHAPPAVLRSGGVGVRDVRALGEVLGTDETGAATTVELAYVAGLVGRDDAVWAPALEADAWLDAPTEQRWLRLAEAWLDAERVIALAGGRDDRDRVVNVLSHDLERPAAPGVRRRTLEVLAGLGDEAYADPDEVVAAVAWHRPRRGTVRDLVARATLAEAEVLGLVARRTLVPAGRALLAGDDAAAVLAPLVPEPVDHVLLQADLTAVAPGPLVRDVASALGDLADVESRGGATVFRFSASSLRRALDLGWPADRVHAFLAEHSRTPVPQPLGYLVDDVARTHGRLRIGNASVFLRSDDPTELDSLEADAGLVGLRLRRLAPTVVVTDADPDTVLARLRAAGRAALAEGIDGAVHTARPRPRRAPSVRRRPATPAPTADTVARLVASVRSGDAAALARPPARDDRRRESAPATIATLREAAESGTAVWLAYLDRAGTPSERIVEPVRVEGGQLTAYDQRSGRNRTFSVHRISRAVPHADAAEPVAGTTSPS